MNSSKLVPVITLFWNFCISFSHSPLNLLTFFLVYYTHRLPLSWTIFFHPFTFILYVSLGLKWVSCIQHIYGSSFYIHSASLCLLVGAFNPFTFKIISDMYVPITIFLIVLGLFLWVFFFSCVSRLEKFL